MDSGTKVLILELVKHGTILSPISGAHRFYVRASNKMARVLELFVFYSHAYVAVFPWLGMVFTKRLDVTDRSSKVIRRLLANSFLGRALTPALPMVVLVSFNHVTTLALVQLGIQNYYSNNISLEIVEGAPTSPKQDGPANRVTRSFDWLGEADLVLPD